VIQKLLLIMISILISGQAKEIQVIPLSNNSINYKSKIYSQYTRLIQVNKNYKCDEYLDVTLLKSNKYFAKHYIAKNKPICLKDVYIPKINKVKFRFGNLEIEKEAELIRETKSYIKIKNVDGTIEKIYTDGRKY